jgi:GNAT superfamily N-acetyltransferase
LGADLHGELVGSNFAANWGSVGFFGPLTVRPDLWDRGIASRLLESTMELFDGWNTKHAGLFTFAHSPKHIGLYQKFGFWPQFLTAIMSRSVGQLPE